MSFVGVLFVWSVARKCFLIEINEHWTARQYSQELQRSMLCCDCINVVLWWWFGSVIVPFTNSKSKLYAMRADEIAAESLMISQSNDRTKHWMNTISRIMGYWIRRIQLCQNQSLKVNTWRKRLKTWSYRRKCRMNWTDRITIELNDTVQTTTWWTNEIVDCGSNGYRIMFWWSQMTKLYEMNVLQIKS